MSNTLKFRRAGNAYVAQKEVAGGWAVATVDRDPWQERGWHWRLRVPGQIVSGNVPSFKEAKAAAREHLEKLCP